MYGKLWVSKNLTRAKWNRLDQLDTGDGNLESKCHKKATRATKKSHITTSHRVLEYVSMWLCNEFVSWMTDPVLHDA